MRVEFYSAALRRLYDADMSAVPRAGDTVTLPSGEAYTVERVEWHIGEVEEDRPPLVRHRAIVHLSSPERWDRDEIALARALRAESPS